MTILDKIFADKAIRIDVQKPIFSLLKCYLLLLIFNINGQVFAQNHIVGSYSNGYFSHYLSIEADSTYSCCFRVCLISDCINGSWEKNGDTIIFKPNIINDSTSYYILNNDTIKYYFNNRGFPTILICKKERLYNVDENSKLIIRKRQRLYRKWYNRKWISDYYIKNKEEIE